MQVPTDSTPFIGVPTIVLGNGIWFPSYLTAATKAETDDTTVRPYYKWWRGAFPRLPASAELADEETHSGRTSFLEQNKNNSPTEGHSKATSFPRIFSTDKSVRRFSVSQVFLAAMQVTDRDDDDDEVDVNCDQETRVPPSTPIHTVRPKNAAYAFPGMQVNAVLAAGSMKAAVSPSGTFSSCSASSAPTKPAVSFADERAPSHDRKRSRRALQDDSAIEDIMSQSKPRQSPAAHHLLTPPC